MRIFQHKIHAFPLVLQASPLGVNVLSTLQRCCVYHQTGSGFPLNEMVTIPHTGDIIFWFVAHFLFPGIKLRTAPSLISSPSLL